jgi:Pretoxin HINT domain
MRQSIALAALVALAPIAGCYSPDVGNGQLECSVPDNKCPSGFHCAVDGTCWQNGQDPDLGVAGDGPQTIVDLAGLDFTGFVPPDLTKVKLDIGGTCMSNDDCLSTFCADGVCCQTDCSATCMSCAEPSSPGTCVARGAGNPPPHGTCAAAAQSTCGLDGNCDGTGNCEKWNNVVCMPGTCSMATNSETGASMCDGMGNCVAATTVTCAPFVCKPDNSACYTTCTAGSTECLSPNVCAGGSCGPKANGANCTTSSECQSSNCVDTFCCDMACTGECQACDVSGKQGMCSQVTGAPHGSRTACTGTGTCGGSCSTSLTACTYPTVSCRTQSCSNAIKTVAASCNGAGACPAVSTTPCTTGFACNSGGTDCNTTCTGDSNCVSGYWCNTSTSTCTIKGGNGTMCSATDQCTSGLCVDGRCCNSACTGQCQACDTASAPGTCTQVLGAPHGSRGACAGSGACASTCTNTSQTTCTFPTSQCRAQSCASGVQTNAANCDGAGNCPGATTANCAPYVCNGTACGTSCTADSACAAGLFCNTPQCLTTEPNGRTCSTNAQCTSNICVDATCCSSACTGQCQFCGNTSGTCNNISGAPEGGRAPCPTGTNDKNNTCGGTCNGSSSACVFAVSGTTCVETSGASSTCNGTGTCTMTCFVAGTPVETERGSRAIETIRPGDRVRSFDTTTGKPSWQEVVRLEQRVAPSVVAVMLDGGAPIEVSPEHYFWVLGSGWVRARDLTLDDRLMLSGGDARRVTALASLRVAEGGVPVFNLVVAGFDNYFVGTVPVLVHSCDYLGFSTLQPDLLPR